jgi:hypothetical protein
MRNVREQLMSSTFSPLTGSTLPEVSYWMMSLFMILAAVGASILTRIDYGTFDRVVPVWSKPFKFHFSLVFHSAAPEC